MDFIPHNFRPKGKSIMDSIDLKSFRNLFAIEGLLYESSLAELCTKYAGADSGAISCIKEFSEEGKIVRSAELKAVLVGAEYSVTTVNGLYIENNGTKDVSKTKAHMFVVFDRHKTGNLRRDLIKLGLLYGQEAVTYHSASSGTSYLIGTSKKPGSRPPYGQEVRLEGRLFGRNGTCPASCNGIPFVFQSEGRGEHGFDDVLRSYSGVWHKQALSNLAKKKLG